MLVERKTWPDLAKSLSDGRYAEQKARLLSAVFAGAEEESDEAEVAEVEAAVAELQQTISASRSGSSEEEAESEAY